MAVLRSKTGLPVYLAYGQRIKSDWRLDLPHASGTSADFHIQRAPHRIFLAGRSAARVDQRKDWFHSAVLADGSTYLHWTDLFEFLISPDGGRIRGRPLWRATPEAFKVYLLGQTLSFAMLRRGIEQLHATTVVVDGRAVAFLGNPGYGKSSLGAAFLDAGYSVLTDDMLVLERDRDHFYGHPGPPRIKMFPAMARRVLRGNISGRRMNHATRKLIIRLAGKQLADQKVPLRAIYVLNRPSTTRKSTRVAIRRMPDRKALLKVLTNSFNTVDVEPGRVRRQFTFAAELCRHVPIRRLSYPRKVRLMSQVRDAILADLAQLG